MNSFNRSIEVTFPVVRYHPLVEHSNGVKIRKTHILLDAPRRLGGSPDGSDYLRHRGVGLSRGAQYPSKSAFLPGGILDASGRHIPFVAIDAPEHSPSAVVGFLFTLFAEMRTYQYRLTFGEPEQLNLDDFKSRLIELGKEERKMPQQIEEILAARSFYEVMEAECEPEIVKAYYNTCLVRNWLDR